MQQEAHGSEPQTAGKARGKHWSSQLDGSLQPSVAAATWDEGKAPEHSSWADVNARQWREARSPTTPRHLTCNLERGLRPQSPDNCPAKSASTARSSKPSQRYKNHTTHSAPPWVDDTLLSQVARKPLPPPLKDAKVLAPFGREGDQRQNFSRKKAQGTLSRVTPKSLSERNLITGEGLSPADNHFTSRHLSSTLSEGKNVAHLSLSKRQLGKGARWQLHAEVNGIGKGFRNVTTGAHCSVEMEHLSSAHLNTELSGGKAHTASEHRKPGSRVPEAPDVDADIPSAIRNVLTGEGLKTMSPHKSLRTNPRALQFVDSSAVRASLTTERPPPGEPEPQIETFDIVTHGSAVKRPVTPQRKARAARNLTFDHSHTDFTREASQGHAREEAVPTPWAREDDFGYRTQQPATAVPRRASQLPRRSA